MSPGRITPRGLVFSPWRMHGYLRDFLFAPERAASRVKALSGGERNRLLLARLFTRPANVLVLDEPTNDLDIETLELLESYLIDWPGTVLLVSHDRAFIDHVVTGTLVFEGEGRVQEYVGGYEDWLQQRAAPEREAPAQTPTLRASGPGHVREATAPPFDYRSGRPEQGRETPALGPRKKPSYREQQELDQLPGRINDLELEQQQLNAVVANPSFYKQSAETINQTLARLEALQNELLEAYARWDELDELAKRCP
jgi:ATP-binding cassette subfamily F protein uup